MPPAGPPNSLTPFIGRDAELASVRRLLATTRLLTLTGAGGSGKTRLAAELAADSASVFPDGIVWVELAPVGEAELLPTAVLAALGAEQGARPPMTAILDTLRGRTMLLVLDNCEHIVDAAASMSDALLRANPSLRILATSREALGVGGESAWLVPGLATPKPDALAGTTEAIGDFASVRLFVDRAKAALATFTLDTSNAAAVAQICGRLDGLPLAIELAAARVRTLPPETLAARLDDSFRVLTSGARTAVPRHRTLRAAIDWSYQLLDDRERLLLQRLSTFAGDFSLAAAETVAGGGALEADDVLDTLAALVDKSLVVMREDAGSPRYHLLETIRQFAAAALEGNGEDDDFRERHARAYLDLAQEAAPHLITRDRPEWVRRIHRELDNIRAALAWSREHDTGMHLSLAGKLGWFWYSSGLWSEGRRWLEGALSLDANPSWTAARADVLLAAGVLAALQADDQTAIPWLKESASSFAEVGDRDGEAYALAYLGVSFGQKGDERAIEPTLRALERFRKTGDLYGLRLALIVMSTVHALAGRLEQARTMGEEGVAVAREYGLDRELAIALQVLAGVDMASGSFDRAGDLFRESLAALRRDMSLFWVARGLQMLAFVSHRQSDQREFAFLMGAAEVVREMIAAGLLGHDRDRLMPAIDTARQSLGEDVFQSEWKRGRSTPLDGVIDQAIRAGAAVLPTSPARTASARASDETSPLDVRALGPLEIRRDGVPLASSAWKYAKPRELLLHLLAHRDGRTREQIGLLFWPDASATQVKNSFHVTLHHMRKAIGRADLIVFEKDRYRIAWEAGVRFDASIFEESVTSSLATLKRRPDDASALQQLSEAIELYRGDFLAEEGAGDWHLDLRDRLRGLFVSASMMVGRRFAQSGAHSDAAAAFRRAAIADELNEDAHRQLMTALARAGDRTDALSQYERLARLLRTDLDAEPAAATRSLYERLRQGETV